jgi:hypothetical protein
MKNITQNIKHTKLAAVVVIILCAVAFMSFSFKNVTKPNNIVFEEGKKDSIASVNAFMQVYKVLVSPRCVNCHPAGDVPLQGDEGKLHQMLPRRGRDGKGLYAMKCSNCHQSTNIDAVNTPPGAPHWQLPPANMKMIFEGRTANQLAKQLLNPKTNGNKNMLQLREHANDALVKAGWNMGANRTQPPLDYETFKKAWNTWIDNGAYAPKNN